MKKPIVLAAGLLMSAISAHAKPLKGFILAGQSNMEGCADVSTFDSIGKDPLTAPMLREMRNPDGTPRVCDKVWMSYDQIVGTAHALKKDGSLDTEWKASDLKRIND